MWWHEIKSSLSNACLNFIQRCAEVLSVMKNDSDPATWRDNEKCVLMYSVFGPDMDAIKNLLESGYEFDVEDSSGKTPVINAIMRDNLEEVKILYIGHVIDSINRKFNEMTTKPAFFEYFDLKEFENPILSDLISKLKNQGLNSQRIDEIEKKMIQRKILNFACIDDPALANDIYLPRSGSDSLFCFRNKKVELVIPTLQRVKVILQAPHPFRHLPLVIMYRHTMKNISDLHRTNPDFLNKVFNWETSNGTTLECVEEALSGSKRNDVEIFLKYYFHSTVKEKYGRDLLACLFGNCDPTVISLLKYDQIDVEGRGYDDNTALHFATNRYLIDNMRTLLDGGADPNALNKWKQTPLEIIMRKHRYDQKGYECIRLLLLAGANPFLTRYHIVAVESEYFSSSDLSSNYCIEIVKLLIAQAFVYEALGNSIKHPIKGYLDLLASELEDFYDECRTQLNELKSCKIGELTNNGRKCNFELTIFSIITKNPNKIARYFVDKDLKLIDTVIKNNYGPLNSYYDDLLKRRLKDIFELNRWRVEASEMICEFIGINDPCHLVVDKIVNYLTATDMRKISIIYQIKKNLRNNVKILVDV